MKTLPSAQIVIDTNVIVKLFVPETDSALVDELLSPAFMAPTSLTLFAPDAIYYEVLGILVKYVRHGDVQPSDACQHVEDFLALTVTTVMTGPFLAAAYDLAMRFFITPYDGCYVALADRLSNADAHGGRPAVSCAGGYRLRTAVAGTFSLMLMLFES